MNQVALYQEKIERSPLQFLPSAREEAELRVDAIHLAGFQRDMTSLIREYSLAAALLFAATAGTQYFIAQEAAELAAAGKKTESSFFSKQTLRNVFGGVGALALSITGIGCVAAVKNRRETKKNKELLTPIDI